MTMNGEAFQPGAEQTPVNPLVQHMENLLSAARAGQITSFAYVICPPGGGNAWNAIGPQAGDLFIGLTLASDAVKDVIRNPPKVSRIIPARAIG
jgi:hypothetical protein